MAWLSLEDGAQIQKSAQLGTRFVLGRSREVDVPLPGKDISRKHACIERQDDRYVISDLGSSNGTYVNGARLRSALRLREGDEIRLGSMTFRFHSGDPDESTTPPREPLALGPVSTSGDQTATNIRKVGRFELVRTLGKGGMGEVYEARDQESMETVAVKFIRSQLGKEQAFLEFFHRREAALARQIVHANVVHILDHGITAGRQFISMELAAGRNLHQVLRDESLDLVDILEVLRQTACGLQAAHDQGVVHGDIKPANILLLDNRGVEVPPSGNGVKGNASDSEDGGGILESPLEKGQPREKASRYEDALLEEIERRSQKRLEAAPRFVSWNTTSKSSPRPRCSLDRS